MKAMVLSAGYGTRLGELTRLVPKPMLRLQGHPLLEFIIAHLQKNDFRQIAVNVHFLPQMIREYFGDGAKWDVEISYSIEEELLGTAGGLKRMEHFFTGEKCFLVHYGDILLDQALGPMIELHRRMNAVATMLVHERRASNSVVVMDTGGCVLDFAERPDAGDLRREASSWVNSGVFLFSPLVFDIIPPEGRCDVPRDILPRLVSTGRVYGFPLTGYRCAIDSPERLAQASVDLRDGRCHSSLLEVATS